MKITALDGQHAGDVVEAAYDPSKLVFDRQIVWQRQSSSKGPGDLTFERVEATHASIALLWEQMAEGPIQPDIDKLRRFADIDSVLRRPPKVQVAWGKDAHAIPNFDGVIESLSIRYFGVADGGTPLHAAADLRLEQAVHLKTTT